jgi:hypothetical protein
MLIKKDLVEENYYFVETEFVKLSAEHYRGIANAAGVLLGFLVLFIATSLDKDQVNKLLVPNKSLIEIAMGLFLIALVSGVIHGIFHGKSMLFAFRSVLHPDEPYPSDRALIDNLLDKRKINQEEYDQLYEIPSHHKHVLSKKESRNVWLGQSLAMLCSISFVLACIFIAVFFWRLFQDL